MAALTKLPDERLRLCAEFVRDGAKLADIGTDHAYLPAWLCRTGKCPSAIAADINPEPLKRARLTVVGAELGDRIQTKLSDGLKEIRSDEADDIVIAGMGGELIAKILGESELSRDPDKRFILQPMTKSEVLLKWLCENGFEILAQDCCVAAGKCYTVILVRFSGEKYETDELFYYLGKLRPTQNETHLQFVKGHIARLKKQAKGEARFGALAKSLEEIING